MQNRFAEFPVKWWVYVPERILEGSDLVKSKSDGNQDIEEQIEAKDIDGCVEILVELCNFQIFILQQARRG